MFVSTIRLTHNPGMTYAFSNRDCSTCGAPYTVCSLIWVAKLETSHVLQSTIKTKLIGVAEIAYQCLLSTIL